jgi:hypothetical protein
MVIFHGGVPPRYVVATIQRLKGLAADRVVPGVYIITPKSSDKCLQLSERNDKPLWYWSWVYGRGDAKIYPKDGKMAPNFSDPDMPADIQRTHNVTRSVACIMAAFSAYIEVRSWTPKG